MNKMAENSTPYAERLEKKIDELHSQINGMSNAITRLTERNESYQIQVMDNRRAIDQIRTEVDQAKGGLNLARIIGGTALASVIGFGVWTVQSLTVTQQRLSETNERVSLTEVKVTRVEADLLRAGGE